MSVRDLIWNLAVFCMIFNITTLFAYLTMLMLNSYRYRQRMKIVSERVDNENWYN